MSMANMGNYQHVVHGTENVGESLSDSAIDSSGDRPDLLRRFSATPLTINMRLMGRTIRVDSNNSALLTLAQEFFSSHQYGAPTDAEFVWKLICEADMSFQSTDVPLSAFSDLQLAYVNVGQRGFMAVDHARREAVGYLSEAFLGDDARFRHRPPLDILFCMTASSLGLVSLSGGCVAADGRGVAVFGPPNSGKTTSCYLAARSGLEFQADQLVFLDARQHCVWGDPFPAVFRLESLQFLPELQSQVQQSQYEHSMFGYFDKSTMQGHQARPIAPICSLFLDRQSAGQPELREICPEEAFARLRQCVMFEEDEIVEEQISTALCCLTEKPVYELRYDKDPAIAARYIENMIR